jgi:hypothetical protein
MIAFIAALLVLGNWACARQTSTERSARPLRFTPGSGPLEGDRFVFIDVEGGVAPSRKRAIRGFGTNGVAGVSADAAEAPR